MALNAMSNKILFIHYSCFVSESDFAPKTPTLLPAEPKQNIPKVTRIECNPKPSNEA